MESEDACDIVEEEIERLDREYADAMPILELIKQRLDLIQVCFECIKVDVLRVLILNQSAHDRL